MCDKAPQAQKTLSSPSRLLPTLPNVLRKVEGGPEMEIRTRKARKKKGPVNNLKVMKK